MTERINLFEILWNIRQELSYLHQIFVYERKVPLTVLSQTDASLKYSSIDYDVQSGPVTQEAWVIFWPGAEDGEIATTVHPVDRGSERSRWPNLGWNMKRAGVFPIYKINHDETDLT